MLSDGIENEIRKTTIKRRVNICRHRHRLQGRHLLSTSISSTLDNRRLGGNGHLRSPAYGGTSSGSANTTNNNNDDNNDILPAVGRYEDLEMNRKIVIFIKF